MIAAALLDAGTIYLVIGAALIFGACVYAAKRILRQLTLRQVGVITIVTIVTIGVIWTFLVLDTRRREPSQPVPDLTQPTPLLQPIPD